MPTTLGATENYYEVPFGVAKRAPYSTTRTAKGEWASHRFAAMDNEATNRGVALANTGCAGVETANGTLKTTLLRAPHITLAGLNPDDTSSDHGTHVFHFRMLGYQGSWRQSGMLRYAQELNAPCLIVPDTQTAVTALFTLESENIVLSSVRYADSGLTVIRLYESTGVKTEIQLQISNLQQVWESDLREKPIREIAFADQVIPLTFLPFEIKTLLVKRTLQ